MGDDYETVIPGYHVEGPARVRYADNRDDNRRSNEDLLHELNDLGVVASEPYVKRKAQNLKEMEAEEEEDEEEGPVDISFIESFDSRRSHTLSDNKSDTPPPPRAQARLLRSQSKSSPVTRSLTATSQPSERGPPKSPPSGRGKRARRIIHEEPAKVDPDSNYDQSEEHKGLRSRELRKRTIQQLNPFKFEKHQHYMTKSGRRVTAQKIEKAVQEEIDKKERQPAKKKARVSTPDISPSKIALSPSKRISVGSRLSGSALSVASGRLVDHAEPDPARTTLRIWLDGFQGGSTPTTLKDCADLDSLLDFILKSWKWRFGGQRFSYAIASFPWLTHEANILIRHGLADSFQKMVLEIDNSPVWVEEGDKAQCEVKIMVYLE